MRDLELERGREAFRRAGRWRSESLVSARVSAFHATTCNPSDVYSTCALVRLCKIPALKAPPRPACPRSRPSITPLPSFSSQPPAVHSHTGYSHPYESSYPTDNHWLRWRTLIASRGCSEPKLTLYRPAGGNVLRCSQSPSPHCPPRAACTLQSRPWRAGRRYRGRSARCAASFLLSVVFCSVAERRM